VGREGTWVVQTRQAEKPGDYYACYDSQALAGRLVPLAGADERVRSWIREARDRGNYLRVERSIFDGAALAAHSADCGSHFARTMAALPAAHRLASIGDAKLRSALEGELHALRGARCERLRWAEVTDQERLGGILR
jgi:hypothetical protein